VLIYSQFKGAFGAPLKKGKEEKICKREGTQLKTNDGWDAVETLSILF